MRMRLGLFAIALLTTSPACGLLGRPQIEDECGRVLQESRFVKCIEIVPAKEPCPANAARQSVTGPCK